MNILANSPIQSFNFLNQTFYIKRDDLLSRDFSGNKARKFAFFLHNKPNVKQIISYGSNQSNAMYSLSVLAKILHVKFIYVCNHIPSFLKENPIGNYQKALENKMEILTSENPYEYAKNLTCKNSLFIKEGGAMKEAEFGIKMLADEINEWAKDKIYDIYLPSGTGTTALYLQKHTHLKVFTNPCVGDEEYLKKQFLELESNPKTHPIILNPPKKYHFGRIKIELFYMYEKLKKDTGIEFDLLYDPVGWLSIKEHISLFENPILYIHQGGILGNVSLLQRYAKKFNINLPI